MRGKKTDPQLVDEIRELRWAYRPAGIVRMMAGRLHRRTVYRVLERLRREEEEKRREEAERIRRARMRGARVFRSVAQLPPRARVRAE